MRRFTTAVLFLIVLSVPAAPAQAQGFWRWLEELSGPKIGGPGFDVLVFCYGVKRLERSDGWFVSPNCVDASRNRRWISLGTQVYFLNGKNNLTTDPDDEVNAWAVLGTADISFPNGLAIGGSLGTRRYSSVGGSFSRLHGEMVLKWRPFVTFDSRARTAEGSWVRELLEIRGVLVFHAGFDAGRFGPGTRALSREARPVLVLAFNLVK